MTTEMWDPDQAVTRGPLDEDLEGCCAVDRYGVRALEELHGEPLDVALEQEESDLETADVDDEWVLVDDDPGLGHAFDLMDGPEERAMHVVDVT